jgi:monofunctional biosynthetic peptidoglycan transglycosylase
MIKAVVASEDNRFLDHWGMMLMLFRRQLTTTRGLPQARSQHHNLAGSQNVFLWPARTWIRKGFEVYFTVMIEVVWSKKRIMVVYLNIVETGNGIYGVEAAARKYFHKPAARLTRSEAALIAASLPNPRVRNPAKPTSYMLRRQGRILDLMNKIGEVTF